MSRDLFYCVSVKAGGASFDLSPELTSFTLEEDGIKPDQLTVEVSDPYKVYSHTLQEGMEIEVDLGTTDDHSLLFRGRIYRTSGNFPRDGVPTLRMVACDKSMGMGLYPRNRTWTDTSLEDLVKKLVRPYFNSDVMVELRGNPSFKGNGIRQQDETDLAFLLRLAATYGCEAFVVSDDQGDTLHFVAQYLIMSGEPTIKLYHGRCDVPDRLISFEAGSDVGHIQLPRVFAGLDYETGEVAEAETAEVKKLGSDEDSFADENLTAFRGRDPGRADALEQLLGAAPSVQNGLREELGGVERQVTPGSTTSEDLKERALNQFSTSIRGMQASGTAVGNQRIHAQTGIAIADVGGRFSGTWYLSQVRHVLNREGYQVEIQCQR